MFPCSLFLSSTSIRPSPSYSEAGKVPIDVTLQLRYANLPNNAKLELIPAAVPRSVAGGGSGTNVSISLQLPDGARLKPLDFAVDVTLWDVLGGFEKHEGTVDKLLSSQGKSKESTTMDGLHSGSKLNGIQFIDKNPFVISSGARE